MEEDKEDSSLISIHLCVLLPIIIDLKVLEADGVKVPLLPAVVLLYVDCLGLWSQSVPRIAVIFASMRRVNFKLWSVKMKCAIASCVLAEHGHTAQTSPQPPHVYGVNCSRLLNL